MITNFNKIKLILFSSFIIAISGCHRLGPEYAMFGDNRVNPAGANQLIEKEFEIIDLISLLDPDGKARESIDEKEWKKLSLEEQHDRAFDAFYTYNNLEQRRNRIQEHILAASNQRCNVYKTYMQQLNSRTGFLLGSLTTLFGGVGAIVTGDTAARIAAGSAGITSGIDAEKQKNFFNNLSISVISKGIDARRENIYKQILEDRKSSIIDYPVERAVKDAVHYHGACNIVEGLREVDETIAAAKVTGLEQALESITLANRLQRELQGKPIAFDDTITISKGESVSIDVLANDTDSNGAIMPSTVKVVVNPKKGTAVPNTDGTIQYTPKAGDTGTDSFKYTVEDNDGNISNQATVTITINDK